MKLILLICLIGGTFGEDPMNNEIPINVLDIENSIDDTKDKNATWIEEDLPGPPLSHEDLELAADPYFSMDEENLNGNDPILQAGAFEGDILNTIDQLKEQFNGNASNGLLRNAIRDKHRRWPNGVVPYIISRNYNRRERSVIARAMDEYHQKTCIKFRPRRNERSYIHIKKGRGCSSFVGRTGKAQELFLGDRCVFKGIVIHELMHAIGFMHEQSRADRDNFVKINWQNIEPGMEHNFEKLSLNEIDHLRTPYDTCSLMHYRADAFSKNGRKTIEVRPNVRTECEIGQRGGFSDIDLKKVNILYKCKVCADDFPDCRNWKLRGFCNNTKYENFMASRCKKSCNMCGR